MKAADVAADTRGVTVLRAERIFFMASVVESFGDQVALERDIFSAARTEGFIKRPTDGAMVNDAIVAGGHPHAVEGHAGKISWSDAHVAHDDIRCAEHPHVVFAEAYACAGCSLSSNGEIGIRFADDEAGFERDETRHIENGGARAGLLNGITQTAGAGVVQVRNVQHSSAATALGQASVTFSGGEGSGSGERGCGQCD